MDFLAQAAGAVLAVIGRVVVELLVELIGFLTARTWLSKAWVSLHPYARVALLVVLIVAPIGLAILHTHASAGHP